MESGLQVRVGAGRLRKFKILIMEMFANIRCVTFAELVTQGGILSEPNYKKKVRREDSGASSWERERFLCSYRLRFSLPSHQGGLRCQVSGCRTEVERTNQRRNYE